MVSYTYQAMDLGFMAMIVEIGLMKNFAMVRYYEDEVMFQHTLIFFPSDIDIFNETICAGIEGEWGTHANFAIAMICPILLSMTFLLPQWWKFEKDTSMQNRIWTFFLVLIQFWPQWKMLQLLYMGLCKKDPDWEKEKEKLKRNVGCLGKS